MRERVITLGGGCFWCTEAVFVRVKGVTDVESGYCNGHVHQPSYEQVCEGDTGHVEVVQLRYDDTQVSLTQLLEVFFAVHDPTTLNRQGNDVGSQYRSGIYTESPDDLKQAQDWVAQLNADKVFGKPVATEVLARANYWPAEGYHQDFFERNPHQGYCAFVVGPKVAKFQKTFVHLLRP